MSAKQGFKRLYLKEDPSLEGGVFLHITSCYMEDVFLKALDLLKQMHDHGYVRQSVEEKNVIVINLDDDKLRRVGFMVME